MIPITNIVNDKIFAMFVGMKFFFLKIAKIRSGIQVNTNIFITPALAYSLHNMYLFQLVFDLLFFYYLNYLMFFVR